MNLAGVEVGLSTDSAGERGAQRWEGRGVEEAVFVEDEGVGGLEKVAAGAVAGVVVELEEGEEGEGSRGREPSATAVGLKSKETAPWSMRREAK